MSELINKPKLKGLKGPKGPAKPWEKILPVLRSLRISSPGSYLGSGNNNLHDMEETSQKIIAVCNVLIQTGIWH